jgi:hypothetical protein
MFSYADVFLYRAEPFEQNETDGWGRGPASDCVTL